jgi:HlyD family secretion protein
VKKKWLIAGGALLIAAVIIASVVGGGEKGEKVYTEPVGRRSIESIVSAPGLIDPRVKVNISAHVIGKIERLYFQEGDQVQRGDRLVELEKPVYQAQVDRMTAEVANRRIEVQRARINLENSRVQLGRATRLRDQGIQADELHDRARLDYENARANLAGAEEGVRQADAALKQAREDLTRTTIVSPISGKVVQLSAQEGEVVITGTMNNPGSVIAVIADLSEILAVAEVTETEVVRVRVGQEAKVTVDAIPDEVFEGRVAEIGSSAAVRAGAGGSGIRFFNAKVAIARPDERLRPGMTAQVEIVTDMAGDTLAVPIQSVVERAPSSIRRAGGKKDAAPRASGDEEMKKYVFVVEEGKTGAREVTTGISDASYVTIASGLNGGEEIVTGPFRTLRNLKDEQVVRVEKEAAASRRPSRDGNGEDEDGND